MKRTVAIITTSRADYAHLRWLLHDLARHPLLEPRIIALGPHLSPEFGHTGRQVKTRNIIEVECLLSSDTDVGMAKSLGVATLGLADVLGKMRPDILLVIADRYEMLAPVSVALTLRIPIAHIEGGEITAGAIDDAVRNAITKMAHIHFACTRKAQQRVIAMGEEEWRVHYSGSLSLDHLRRAKLLDKIQLEKQLGTRVGKSTIVCVYHPVTLKQHTTEEVTPLLAALQQRKAPVIIIYPNADAGSRELIRRYERFTEKRANTKLFINLDHNTYLSLLSHAGLLIGNSSSGMIESTSLGLPTINVGERQRGREHAANVLNVPARRAAISQAIDRALSPGFRKSAIGLDNPYGDGNAVERITRILATVPLGLRLLQKTGN